MYVNLSNTLDRGLLPVQFSVATFTVLPPPLEWSDYCVFPLCSHTEGQQYAARTHSRTDKLIIAMFSYTHGALLLKCYSAVNNADVCLLSAPRPERSD